MCTSFAQGTRAQPLTGSVAADVDVGDEVEVDNDVDGFEEEDDAGDRVAPLLQAADARPMATTATQPTATPRRAGGGRRCRSRPGATGDDVPGTAVASRGWVARLTMPTLPRAPDLSAGSMHQSNELAHRPGGDVVVRVPVHVHLAD